MAREKALDLAIEQYDFCPDLDCEIQFHWRPGEYPELVYRLVYLMGLTEEGKSPTCANWDTILKKLTRFISRTARFPRKSIRFRAGTATEPSQSAHVENL